MATPYQNPQRRGSLPLGVVLGVIAGAILVMFAWFALFDDADSATPGPTPTSAQPSDPVESPDPAESPEPDESAEPGDESVPGITTELPVGTWVTVLDSLPQGSVSAEQAIARAAELSQPGHTAIVIDTNRFEGLNANYWAVVIPGAESRAASNAVCKAIGLPVGNNCYPREIKGLR
ncbi:hypothetical protein H5397_07640 [Propioniciclava sp. MC1683]|uniref:hypothetical protein n=1 Tax=Propioniciclava sp. MC1683 TaxID=2760309 RepID=UPI00160061D1|nr:hypothetical protein [Propioniciclava sp. MC1683]MBB1501298.1 hypothetical protein [Propioniciclava sp. MC1683]